MNLYEKIMTIYPKLTQQDFMTVIQLQNDSDGKGDYIKEWNHALIKPTDEQLIALETA
jgi:hypothetical protein